MGYESKFAKSFGRVEPQKLGFAAVAGCFLVSLAYLTLFESSMSPLSSIGVKFRTSLMSPAASMMISTNALHKSGEGTMTKPVCDVSDRRFDLCEMEGDVRMQGKSSAIYTVQYSNESWRIRPYARKGDNFAMDHVREVLVKSSTNNGEFPRCDVNHSVPAIVFSVTGYTGNIFHDFTDVLIPLFITSQRYNGEVQFVVADMNIWWTNKYKLILNQLSRYGLIDFHKDNRTHCFRQATVGLRYHKELTIIPSKPPFGYSMVDFTKFLRTSYSLERDSPIRTKANGEKKPRLLIISRRRTRTFQNLEEIIWTAEESGFEAVVAEANISSNGTRFAKIVNSCDVMMGVHGAGLTNLVFLPTNAVIIQIVPWGGLEWVSRFDFGEPAIDMNLRYLQYKIKEEESSLIEQYPRDHPVFKDPLSIHKKGWLALKQTFLDKQDVKLDVKRFRVVLVEALKLLHK